MTIMTTLSLSRIAARMALFYMPILYSEHHIHTESPISTQKLIALNNV